MKTKRLTERELRGIAHEVPQGRRSWDPYYQAVLECLSYRRALRKVRRYFEPRALEGSMSGSLALQQLNIIDRALGAKR